MRNLFTIFILFIFIVLLGFLANKTYKLSIEYEKEYIKYASTQTFEKKIENQTKDLINNLVNILLQNDNVNKQNIKTNNKEQLLQYKNEIKHTFNYFALILLASSLTYFFLTKVYVSIYLYLVSLMSLGFGIFSPVFLMYVTKNFSSNEIILQFESSSIISSIEKLFLQDNYFVGSIILLFSILFPIIKTIISILALILNNSNIANKLSQLSNKITKFSMTDVFVLSLFLVYLSPKEGGMIKTELEIGFYFFFVYVIISLINGFLLNKNKQIST